MNKDKPHIVIYSHGFGVRRTDRGLFTDISKAIPEVQSEMFEYNPIHEASNTLTVMPLDKQVLKLRKVINTARAEYPGATIDIVCHSQGCVVAALLKPRDIRKIIMITPPFELSAIDFAKTLGERSDIEIDLSIRTRVVHSDGSTTVIHPEYWESLSNIQPIKLYNRLAKFTQLRIINAKQDDVLGKTTFEGLDPSISCVTLNGNHNFNDEEDRKRILYILRKELVIK